MNTSNREEAKYNLVMLRHGQSTWSKRFCGWVDVELTERGLQEAKFAGKLLKEGNFEFDVVFTSSLKRAGNTVDIILTELGHKTIPIKKCWRLNERHYGALTGLDKVETAEKYGEEQVQTWRRAYNIPPPPMKPEHPFYDKIRKNPAFKEVPENEFPEVESLKTTIQRGLPFWHDVVIPAIKEHKRVLIVAHGTSLRGLVKILDDISEEKIQEQEIPTAIPFVYKLGEDLKPVKDGSMLFLGDPEEVKRRMAEVKNQIKKET